VHVSRVRLLAIAPADRLSPSRAVIAGQAVGADAVHTSTRIGLDIRILEAPTLLLGKGHRPRI
jgi:hypothetical protein